MVCRFFFFDTVSAGAASILLRPSPVVKSMVCRVCLEMKRYSCFGDGWEMGSRGSGAGAGGGGGEAAFWTNVSDARWEAMISFANWAIFSFGQEFDIWLVVIGVDVQTGGLFDERMGDGDKREGQLT